MNFWQTNQFPYSWNHRGVTVPWSGSDHKQSYDKNPQQEMWKDVDISYTYNHHGFRTHELVDYINKPVDLALGCSLTEGIGIPVACAWPSIVEESRSVPMLNLGIQSASTDTVARILTNCIDLFDIQQVFILWPDVARFEIYSTNTVESIIPTTAKPEHAWNMDDDVATQRYHKNQTIVHSFGLPINEFTAKNIFNPKSRGAPDRARDGQHFGIQSHRIVAWEFIKDLTAK